MATAAEQLQYLLVRVGAWIGAVSAASVVETMRAQPVSSVLGVPRLVRGVAVIRGAVLPVVDVAALLGAAQRPGGRFVTVRAGERHIALAVDEVLGISQLDAATLESTPPLLSAALPEDIATLGALDGQVIAVLGTARLLDDDTWRAISALEARR